MITRIRIEAQGATAREVEDTLRVAYFEIGKAFDSESEHRIRGYLDSDDEMVIERDLVEPAGQPTAFKGRMRLLLNIANDAGQVAVLRSHGVEPSLPTWSAEEARSVGGVPHV